MNSLKRGDIIDLRIQNLAFGGSGIGKHRIADRDFTVFVDQTVPGDLVRVKIGGRKRNYAIGYVDEFIEKDRIPKPNQKALLDKSLLK